LFIVGIVALLMIAFGIYTFFDATQRYNRLSALDLQPLVATMKENEANARMVAEIEVGKRLSEVTRNQALALIGAGAILVGIASFVYTRLPAEPITQTKQVTQS
jgi:hypothetical protein